MICAKGKPHFFCKCPNANHNRRREQLLNVTTDEVRRVAQKYIVEGLKAETNKALAVLGEKGKWVNPAEGWQVLDLSQNAQSTPREEFDVNEGKVML